MKNRNVGIIIVCISLLIGALVYLFNRALTEIVTTSCSHGTTCPMWGSIKFQTYTGLAILLFVLLFGAYMIFFAKETIPIPKKTKEDYKETLTQLEPEEKRVLEKIIEEGSIFQSKIVEDTGLSKVKITRIIDRLEGKGLIERKRRGMTNIVILKHP